MADTASVPEGSGDEVSSEDAPSSRDAPNSRDEASSRDEVQRKFREALDRKRAREMASGSAGRGKETGKIHGVHGPARHRRSFRRKSGG